MALTLKRDPDGWLRGEDGHWRYVVISYRSEHRVEITRLDDASVSHTASLYTRKGATQLAREFHKLGEDYDPSTHEGRSRFEQAKVNTDEP
ncbi:MULTISPECIES: hypothetical protein [Nocardia]|uniref:hypothetical protein n=1 Tax=Nocardia beijingensis TaxID=95162 RepID=UPI0033AEB6AE